MGSLISDVKPVVKSSYKGKICYNEDPMKYLIKNDLAVQVGNGLFVLKGVLVDILNIVDELTLKIAKKVGTKEVFVPCILSYDNAKKSEYLNSFKHQALLLKTIEENDFEGLACPTVCYHYSNSFSPYRII